MLKAAQSLARALALMGGVVLIALILLTCVSVLGRGANTFGHSAFLTTSFPGLAEALIGTGVGPVLGDFELVEAGIAFAIFCFLPICQLHGSHATVDVFTARMNRRANRVLVAFWEAAFAVLIVLICLRLYTGMSDKIRYGEVTFLLQFPVWWAYAASLLPAIGAAVIAVYCAIARVAEAVTDRAFLPLAGGDAL